MFVSVSIVFVSNLLLNFWYKLFLVLKRGGVSTRLPQGLKENFSLAKADYALILKAIIKQSNGMLVMGVCNPAGESASYNGLYFTDSELRELDNLVQAKDLLSDAARAFLGRCAGV
jgi:hypothetical protein